MSNTPLAWASGNGHEAVVEMLLGRADIDPNKPGEDGQTPLGCAAKNGYEGAVKILLGQDDVNPTNLVRAANHHSGGLLKTGTRER